MELTMKFDSITPISVITVRLPKKTHLKFLGLCQDNKISMNEQLNLIIEEWVHVREQINASTDTPPN